MKDKMLLDRFRGAVMLLMTNSVLSGVVFFLLWRRFERILVLSNDRLLRVGGHLRLLLSCIANVSKLLLTFFAHREGAALEFHAFCQLT